MEKIISYLAWPFVVRSKRQKIKFLSDPQIRLLYEQLLPLISKSYSKAKYWHGTGRYHYQSTGNSKYEGTSSTPYDILASIVKDKGLKPHYDPWISLNGGYSNSISLATVRMYGCAYAKFHLDENTSLQFEYGTSRFWFWYLMFIQLVQGNWLSNLIYTLTQSPKLVFNEQMAAWISTIRADAHTRKRHAIDILSGIRSDIPD